MHHVRVTLFGLILALVLADASNVRLASVTWSESEGYRVHDHEAESYLALDRSAAVSWGNYTNGVNRTGWAYLEVYTNKQYEDSIQATAAGLLEGRVTAGILRMYWQNTVAGYCTGKEKICKAIKKYLVANEKWMRKMIGKYRSLNPYWHHVGLFYDQFDGLVAGYNDAAATDEPISSLDLFWMNIFGDLFDLEKAVVTKLNITDEVPHRPLGGGSCSAIIKLLRGNSDLLCAHNSWNGYETMLRILKKYSLNFHWPLNGHKNKLIPGRTTSFSGYPGVIYSGDDFHVISSGLVTIETTIGNENPAIWHFVKPVGQIVEGVRVTVANRLATNGKEWTEIFRRRNSGTYNNQWMIVDYKKFKPGMRKMKQGLLWILEQLPNLIHAEDLTWVLEQDTYWPSYNNPYFKDIFDTSGMPAKVAKYGDYFDHEKTCRARIFRRDHSNVVDIASLTRLMRYNNFKKDPLARCEKCTPPYTATCSISARSDLNDPNGTYPFKVLGHGTLGGLDTKMTTSSLVRELAFVAAGGPTFDDLPPFQWSKTDFGANVSHVGQPDLWQFEPIQHKWTE